VVLVVGGWYISVLCEGGRVVGLEIQVTAHIVGGYAPSDPTDPLWGTPLGKNLCS
jgi:hypothetical protein